MLYDFANAVERTSMTGHTPVLLRETLELLQHAPELSFLDCTFGGGGHTEALLKLSPDACVTAIDQDPDAAERVRELQATYGSRLRFHAANFEALDTLPEGPFAGVLFDLGVSSYHFDQGERGFSFRLPGPLDMRMNPGDGQSAAEFLETASREELIKAIRNHGEEPRWRKVIDAIEKARGTDALRETTAFAALVADAIGQPKGRPSKIHPATRVFQGLRIAVNRELEVLETALPKAFAALQPGGVLAVISFHSLEDRMVKRFFRHLAGQPESARDNRPQQERPRWAEALTRKPITPGEVELQINPRARSSKLRAVRKLTLEESTRKR